MRFVIVAAVLLCASPAYAIKCSEVRPMVERYGQAAVEWWARNNGYTEKQIEWARVHCAPRR